MIPPRSPASRLPPTSREIRACTAQANERMLDATKDTPFSAFPRCPEDVSENRLNMAITPSESLSCLEAS